MIGYQQITEQIRIPYIKLNDTFLSSHGLTYKAEMAEFEKEANNVVTLPQSKPNFAQMAKTAQID